MERFNDRIREDINFLVNRAIEIAGVADTTDNIHQVERFEKQALAYFSAANSLLRSTATLHNEFIDQPDFVKLRKLQRKY